MTHLSLHCPYIKEVWKECSKALELVCRWEGVSVLLAWEKWRRSETLEDMTTLALLVIWGVWLARNNIIFMEKVCTPTITTSLAC